LVSVVHRICCAAVARSRGLTESYGVKILRHDRHFISESSFCSLLQCKDGSSGYGGLNFLDSVRQQLLNSSICENPVVCGSSSAADSDCSWSAPDWMSSCMQQRLLVMCDTMWLMSQCVSFSEELRTVADRPSRRARLTSLLQVCISALKRFLCLY
jgi:hypothetical protein